MLELALKHFTIASPVAKKNASLMYTLEANRLCAVMCCFLHERFQVMNRHGVAW
eukprot:m.164141 g.164141  ORF g.164141 m.164141 type:complete len:54 (-) comp53096_c2_seq5:46-207(-)